MIKRRRFPKIYYGWWMNLVMGILSGLAGGLVHQGISVLFKPIASDLGLGRAATSIATSIARLEGGFEATITGLAADKFGAKWVLVSGALVMGIGLVFMYFFVHSAWTYYVIWGVIVATGHNLGYTIAHDKVLTDWFVSKRGLNFGIRFALLSIMAAIALPVISWLVTTEGWRMTCLIWAGVIFAGIPFTLYFIKPNRPEYYGLLPDGAKFEAGAITDTKSMIDKGVEYAAGFQEMEFTLRQAMKTPAYWILTIAWCMLGITSGGFTLHCIPFLTDMNIDPGVAAGLMAMMVFFTIPSRFLAGFLADRFKKEHLNFLMAGAFLLMTIGITSFLLNQTTTMVYVFLILWGFGYGAMTPLGITIRGRYFGRKAYGSIQGTSQMFAMPISIVSPIYAGWIYDTTGSYITAFTTFAATAAFGFLLLCFLRPPKPPAEVTDIRKFM